MTWSGEYGVESSSTGECICGWTESASSQREVRNEYRSHLQAVLARGTVSSYVYCMGHLRPHSPDPKACGVGMSRKLPLVSTTKEEAYAEVRRNGWPLAYEDGGKFWGIFGNLV